MKLTPVGAIVAVAILSVARVSPLAQAPTQASHPSFAGTWAPSAPADSDRRWDIGIAKIPGQGRLTIDQQANRLTVTITIPEDKLAPRLAIQGRVYPTVIYQLFEPTGRSGGYGAGGPPKPTQQATWVNDQLVISNPWPGLARPTTETYALDGDHLVIETRVDMSPGRVNDLTERFDKMR
jgi:hypothetical protein